MTIEVRPAINVDDLRTMVGPKRPDANVCWCLSYRIPSKENLALRGPARGERVARLAQEDPPPGVLAYDGDAVVGLAAVHPRADTGFARNRKIPTSTTSTCGRCGAFECVQDIGGRALLMSSWLGPSTSLVPTVLRRLRHIR